ncbi:ABC transporter substrate-binding protein [Bradyrhizobium sp. BWA-3-5]|uniref:ABC transporter substrate-binding protein n=1 Tax=Bradyrhizobium sp. BWA-3-5 TaxID=3080013 RepID=UPI00293F18DB|nr:ABC transporter substrate-binding protein [Bradyrhizobium sp. BWA-3-5]WOH63734.1 ABC transporter substrate-binding protein [Bradyrhizobium sp. BWA-3-5]
MIMKRRSLLKGLTAFGITFPMLGRRAFAQDAGTLRLGLLDYPLSLIPGKNNHISTQGVILLMHRGLLTYNFEGKIEGDLAESVERDGEASWLVKLRPDVLFSDGTPVTAADVKYSIERMASKELGSVLRANFATIAPEVVDGTSVRLVTKTPDATIPSLLANQQTLIIKANSDHGSELGIGAGPFVLHRFEQGSYVELVRSKHYFRTDLPHVSRVRVVGYIDEASRVSALTAGDVDFIDYVPYNSMDKLEATAGVKLRFEQHGGLLFLVFSGKGIFADPRLRKAAAFAIRREEIVKGALYGRGAPLNGTPRPDGTPYFLKENVEYWRYDPGYARSLLAEAGHRDGFKCKMLAASDLAQHRDAAILVQTHLAEIGIKVDLLFADYATRQAAWNRGEGDFGVNGTGMDSLDPSAFDRIQDPSQPIAAVRSHDIAAPGLTELLAKGKQEFDAAKRAQIYRQADAISLEHTTLCGLAYRGTGFAHAERLKGFQVYPGLLSPYSMRSLNGVSVSK